MKVAIIGAGPAGLACAWELKKNGYTPVIFEKKERVGHVMEYTGAILKNFLGRFSDPIYYAKKKYEIDINVIGGLNEIEFKFPNREFKVIGSLGYLIERSSAASSVESYMAKQINPSIIFNIEVAVEDIKNDFDYIVVATGDYRPAEKMGIWTENFRCYSRVTRVIGDFKIGACKVWFNTEYSNHMFCYLLSKNQFEATLVQIIDNIPSEEYDSYWEGFIKKERLEYKIKEKNDTIHYCGLVFPVKVGNVIFVGKSAGLIDNIVGVGTIDAIDSGVLAAQDILGKVDYNYSIRPCINKLNRMREIRKAINIFSNEEFNTVGKILSYKIIQNIIYGNSLFKIWQLGPLVKLYNYFSGI